MGCENRFQKARSAVRKAAAVYTVLGGLYMFGQNVTGHPSADDYLSRNPVVQENIQESRSTGHLSSDLFLKKTGPTRLEDLLLTF